VTLMFLYVLLRMDDVMADLTIDVNVVIGTSSKPSETMVRSHVVLTYRLSLVIDNQ